MAQITLLDGSIGQELVHRADKAATPLWSTQSLLDNPGMVADVHRDYFAAGASVATTNTYAIHASRLDRVGLHDRISELRQIAIDQAEAARAAHGSGRLAGSVGPFLATYRPDLQPDADEAAHSVSEFAAELAPRVDAILLETVSSLLEAEGMLRGATGHGKPVWISFSVSDDDGSQLRSGEPLADALDLITRHGPDAVLLNCSRPEAIDTAIPILAGFGKPYGAYANGFTRISEAFLEDFPTIDSLKKRVDLPPEAYADHVMAWVDQGATIVGGCCEVGPAHIAEIANRLKAQGHKIV